MNPLFKLWICVALSLWCRSTPATPLWLGADEDACRTLLQTQVQPDEEFFYEGTTGIHLRFRIFRHIPYKMEERRPLIVAIPGGPGLSSETLRNLLVLRRTYDVVLVDPPGTAGLPEIPELLYQQFTSGMIFQMLSESVALALQRLGQPVILVGHSAGGWLAGEVALQAENIHLPVRGLVMVASPMTRQAYTEILPRQLLQVGGERWIQAVRAYSADANSITYKQLLLTYPALIFVPSGMSSGTLLLTSDSSSPLSLKNLIRYWDTEERFARSLAALKIRRLMIAGEKDLLLPIECLQSDAQLLDADFVTMAGAGHCPFLDFPNRFAGIIETHFPIRSGP